MIDGSSKFVTGRAVDVSRDGIGILSSDYLREGDTITLTTRDKNIPLKVLYKKRDYAKNSRYRYGLVLADDANKKECNLIQIFSQSGCMSE